MTLRMKALTLDVPDAEVAAAFWAGLLDRDMVDDGGAVLLPGDATQVGLRFVTDPLPVVEGDRDIHLHVTSDHAPSQQHVVDHALEIGAARGDVGQQPDEDHVVLVAPDGHPFCVIEAGNNYLADTGLLGEIAWGGPPVTPLTGRVRQRFDLTVPADDLHAELDRLVALGASRLLADASEITLSDPDGNEFRLVVAHLTPS